MFLFFSKIYIYINIILFLYNNHPYKNSNLNKYYPNYFIRFLKIQHQSINIHFLLNQCLKFLFTLLNIIINNIKKCLI